MPIRENTTDGVSGGYPPARLRSARPLPGGYRPPSGAGLRTCTANADLRNTGEGGWCYTEHELFSVFLPLIGADGGMVYMAMTRLVPLAALRAELPVTVEAVSRESCVSRSTAHRKIRELVQLGMVLETRSSSRRPSAYQLPPLRALARLGEPELRRRLDALRSAGRAKGAAGAGPVADAPAFIVSASATAGGASSCGADGIPGWDTVLEAAYGPPSGTPVSHGAVPLSQPQGAVSQPGMAFNLLEEELENEDSSIPPTPQGGSRAGLSAGSHAGRPAERAESAAAGTVGARVAPRLNPLAAAARWVLQQSGVSATRRLETMLVGQLELALQRSGSVPPQSALPQMAAQMAAQMVERWQAYLGMCRRQELRIQWGFARFFAEGLWAQPAAWPRRRPFASGGFEERDREPGILRGTAAGAVSAAGSSAGAAENATACAPAWEVDAAACQAAAREAEARHAALDYWRRMRQRGVAIYAQEAPHWVRSVLESEPAAASG